MRRAPSPRGGGPPAPPGPWNHRTPKGEVSRAGYIRYPVNRCLFDLSHFKEMVSSRSSTSETVPAALGGGRLRNHRFMMATTRLLAPDFGVLSGASHG